MTVNLPTAENNSGTNDWSDVYANDKALKEAVETLQSEVSAISGITWYTPKAIATEQSRESATYGFLTTEDKIESVEVAENALVLVWYSALWKESKSDAARGALFIGANQLKLPVALKAPQEQAARTGGSEGGAFLPILSAPQGLISTNGGGSNTSWVTTGMAFGSSDTATWEIGETKETADSVSGILSIFRLAAGTYTIGVKYKATSGSVTAKERLLQVAVVG